MRTGPDLPVAWRTTAYATCCTGPSSSQGDVYLGGGKAPFFCLIALLNFFHARKRRATHLPVDSCVVYSIPGGEAMRRAIRVSYAVVGSYVSAGESRNPGVKRSEP